MILKNCFGEGISFENTNNANPPLGLMDTTFSTSESIWLELNSLLNSVCPMNNIEKEKNEIAEI
jgi:hypothetical protein